jgi:alpha-1,3-mannosyl-glycoprotein beta-1,2-N-acetylglucosaminyltransferase
LKRIQLNEKPVEFTRMDLSNLLQQNYDREFLQRVYSLPTVTIEDLMRPKEAEKDTELSKEYRLEYGTMDEFLVIARRVGIMADTKVCCY